jgi:hypothetical protein
MNRILPLVTLCAAADLSLATVEGLRREAYVWQRAWTTAVTNTVAIRAPSLDGLVVLQAEVTWTADPPRCARATLDYALLASLRHPVGLALRVGGFAETFAPGDAHTAYLATLAKTLVTEAGAQGLQPSELQLDFDCAESKLASYRVWLKAIRQAVAPLPVHFTALPSWLKRSEFKALAADADGFVLQVHSFEPPRSPDEPLTLCDPQQAMQAVRAASALGRPFRVALPTYGYRAAFTPKGEFLGLSAEGPVPHWPKTARVVEVRADPDALSQLVRHWTQHPVPHLEGLLWYRLPMPDDELNWRWPTLQAVQAGQAPSAAVRAVQRRPQPGLVEFELVNEGSGDASALPTLTIRWQGPGPLAADGLGRYEAVAIGPHHLRFDPAAGAQRLQAGERMAVGWIRFEANPELTVELDGARN